MVSHIPASFWSKEWGPLTCSTRKNKRGVYGEAQKERAGSTQGVDRSFPATTGFSIARPAHSAAKTAEQGKTSPTPWPFRSTSNRTSAFSTCPVREQASSADRLGSRY